MLNKSLAKNYSARNFTMGNMSADITVAQSSTFFLLVLLKIKIVLQISDEISV